MPPEMVEAFKPEYVAPVTAFLGSKACPETGSIFEVGCGWVAKTRWQRSGGVAFPVNKPLEPENIAAAWPKIVDFEDGRATYPSTMQEALEQIMSNFASASQESSADNGKLDVEAVKKAKFETLEFSYTERDVILYALGVGAKRTELQWVYENNENFSVLPTFGVIPSFANMNAVPFSDFFPKFNPMMLLHGEQYLEIRRPAPTSGKLISDSCIVDILDKGKAASVIVGVTTKDESGAEVFYNEYTLFIRGVGGFGGRKTGEDRGAATATNNPPKREPDAVVHEKTGEDQAALYRLSGDWNPLHIDPEMSKMGGFDVPILHGLCTFGIAGKHILKTFANNDPTAFKSIKARFAKHVFPGETLETRMWKEGNNVFFETYVVERKEKAISNGRVELTTTLTAKL